MLCSTLPPTQGRRSMSAHCHRPFEEPPMKIAWSTPADYETSLIRCERCSSSFEIVTPADAATEIALETMAEKGWMALHEPPPPDGREQFVTLLCPHCCLQLMEWIGRAPS